MLYLIIYDITTNKIRNWIVKILEQSECKRLQKSVFMVKMPAKDMPNLLHKLRSIQRSYPKLWQGTDNIIVFPFEKDQFRQSECIGNNELLENFQNPPHTLFF